MPRRERGNGEGTIYAEPRGRRDLRWRVVITIGWGLDGKVIRLSRYFVSQEDAEIGLAEMLYRRDAGLRMPTLKSMARVICRVKAGEGRSIRPRSYREHVSKRLRFDVLNRDGFACHYCGRRPPEIVLHLDHVDPVAGGGATEEGNLVAACRDCNLGKAARYKDGLGV